MEISEDIGEKVIGQLKDLSKKIGEVMERERVREREFPCPPPCKFREKKTCQIHLALEKTLFDFLKNEADAKGISLNDCCLRRIKGF